MMRKLVSTILILVLAITPLWYMPGDAEAALTRTTRGTTTVDGDGTLATGSFTPNNNSLLVAIVSGVKDWDDNTNAPDITVGGGNLTWTQQAQVTTESLNYIGWWAFVEIWTVEVSTGASMTVTTTPTTSFNGRSLSVYEYTGYDTSDPVGATSTGSRQNTQGAWTITLNATPASNSEVLGGVAADNFNASDISAGIITTGTGWTQLHAYPSAGAETHAHTQATSSPFSTSVTWNKVDALVSGDNGAMASAAAIEIKAAAADTSPPTPDPMTFASAPSNDSTTAISMTSTTGSDASGPVEYLFAFNACASDGGTGGTSSSWQTSTSYTDSGLQANQCYGYTVQARDSIPNTGTASSASEEYTSAATPGAPTLSNQTTTTFELDNDANGNPSSNPTTNFAVQISATSPTDATWDGKYVNASGDPSDTAVWMSDTTIDALTVDGLTPGTQYTVRVKARNQDSDETSFGTTAQITTEEAVAKVFRLKGGTRFIGGVRLR